MTTRGSFTDSGRELRYAQLLGVTATGIRQVVTDEAGGIQHPIPGASARARRPGLKLINARARCSEPTWSCLGLNDTRPEGVASGRRTPIFQLANRRYPVRQRHRRVAPTRSRSLGISLPPGRCTERSVATLDRAFSTHSSLRSGLRLLRSFVVAWPRSTSRRTAASNHMRVRLTCEVPVPARRNGSGTSVTVAGGV